MKWCTLSVIGLLAALAIGQEPPPGAPEIPPDAAKRLAEDLVADATPGYVPEDLALHLRRAVVLTSFASRLDPSYGQAWRVRAEALEMLGDLPAAAEAEERHLELTDWAGYESGTRWIRYRLAMLDTAEQRLEMLRGVADREQRPPTLRALALVNMAVIAEGRGDNEGAIALYRRALDLDPTQESALQGLLRLTEAMSAPERIELSLGLLAGNPLAVNVAWEIGQICRDLGLYERALELYGYAHAVAEKNEQIPSETFRRDLLDCLVDAGRHREALAEYSAVIAPGVVDLPVAGMLVEAARALGDTAEARRHIELMREAYRPYEVEARTKGAVAAEVAWFHYYYRQRPFVAANWAAIARNTSPDDAFVQRVWAVTHLAAEAEAAREVLRSLRHGDLYALTALIEDALTRGDQAAAEAYLDETMAFGRRGPAWRQLRRLVGRHDVSLPDPPATAEPIGALVDGFVQSPVMRMGQAPEQFITVHVEPVAAEIEPGSRPEAVVRLTNIGDAPVPIGSWGLLPPNVMLAVRMYAPRERHEVIQQIPVIWETPRRLEPGQSVSRTVALDSGAVSAAMAFRPIGRIELTVETVVDPVQREDTMVSGAPAIVVEPIHIVRKALVEAETPAAYDTALKMLVRRFRGDDQLAAMQAAEATVSLLALAEQVRAGRTGPAGRLGRDLRQPELLSMLRYCLQQAAPAVRVRTLGAMDRLTPTPLMVQLLGPCLADRSALVRARAVEVLASAADGRRTPLLARLAETDPDPLVRQMAEVFLIKAEKP